MKSCIQIIPEFNQCDAEFVYKNRHFPYSSRALIYHQGKKNQQQQYHFDNKQVIKFDRDISADSFATFVKVLGFNDITINEYNYLDLIFLSVHFNTKEIRKKVRSYIASNMNLKYLINDLIFEQELNLKTDKQEEIIAKEIVKYIELKEFARIPIEIINRIITDETAATSDQLYLLIKHLYDNNCSFEGLQRLIDYDKLNPEYFDSLDKMLINFMKNGGTLPKNFLSIDQKKQRHDKAIEKKNNEIKCYIDFIGSIINTKVELPPETKHLFDTKIIEACANDQIEFVKQIIGVCSKRVDSELICKCLNQAIANKYIEVVKFFTKETKLQEKLVSIYLTKSLNSFMKYLKLFY